MQNIEALGNARATSPLYLGRIVNRQEIAANRA
jgi:hypothetical protein